MGRRGGFWGLNRFNGGGVGSATGRGSSSSSSEGVEYALHRRSMADLGLCPASILISSFIPLHHSGKNIKIYNQHQPKIFEWEMMHLGPVEIFGLSPQGPNLGLLQSGEIGPNNKHEFLKGVSMAMS